MHRLQDFKPRLYQQTIMATATKQNTLVVLPTGIGKTAIALMLAIQRLNALPEKKVLVLAPTRPLVNQHHETFREKSTIPDEAMTVVTGQVAPQKRQELYTDHQVIFSTPQGLENDVISQRFSLSDVSLIVFDEAHRAVGDYSYVLLAKLYASQADHLILGLTASPGSGKEEIEEVCRNLFIDHVEQRTKESGDVKPYVQKTDVRYIMVDMDETYKNLITLAKKAFIARINEIKRHGFLKQRIATHITKKDLLGLQAACRAELNQKNFDAAILSSISLAAQAMKLMHAIELLESQGIAPAGSYLDDLFEQAKTTSVKATIAVAEDPMVRLLRQRIKEQVGAEHPKLTKLCGFITERVAGADAKIIVFCQYRDSIMHIVERLNDIEGVHAKEFIGQAKKRGQGLSQKQQIERVAEFAAGKFNVLVMSSVGEEGLDIPEVNSVMFYEPIPSAIRSIQRRGRTGRHAKGEVLVLVAKGTRDEAYRWSAYHKEKRVHETIAAMKKVERPRRTLADYDKASYTIIADFREKTRGIMSAMMEAGVRIKMERLEAADYLLSPEVGVEFKTAEDFVDSIIDGRLLDQLPKLKQAFPSPLVVVQGEDIFSIRNIHPNAIYGMLSTIALSFRIPILFTRNTQETANLFMAIAKREQEGSHTYSPLAAKPGSVQEQQEFLVGSLPGVGIITARRLLAHFGSVDAVFSADAASLEQVEGVGAKIAAGIRDFIVEKYKTI